jgi:hypothetical protein
MVIDTLVALLLENPCCVGVVAPQRSHQVYFIVFYNGRLLRWHTVVTRA